MKKICLLLIFFGGYIYSLSLKNSLNKLALKPFKTCEKERIDCWEKARKSVENTKTPEKFPTRKPKKLNKEEKFFERCMLEVNEKKRRLPKYYCDIWKDQDNTDLDWEKWRKLRE